MIPYMSELYYNPSSRYLQVNEITKKIGLEKARTLEYLNLVDEKSVCYTSGATESINLSIPVLAEMLKEKGSHILTAATEHKAMLDVMEILSKQGYDIEFIPVDAGGLVDPLELERKIRKDTILISIMYCNNETGVIQPIEKIGEIAKDKQIVFFSDVTQAFGKLSLNVAELGIDVLCFSAHKFHGPKGVGGLVCIIDSLSKKTGIQKKERLLQLISKAGTANVAGIIGLGKALEVSILEMDSNIGQITMLRDKFEDKILNNCLNVSVNGSTEKRIYNTTNLSFKGKDIEPIIDGYLGILVSNGSACNAFSEKSSHVLRAMGLSDEEANSSIRFSFSKYNTSEEVEKASDIIIKYFRNLG